MYTASISSLYADENYIRWKQLEVRVSSGVNCLKNNMPEMTYFERLKATYFIIIVIYRNKTNAANIKTSVYHIITYA